MHFFPLFDFKQKKNCKDQGVNAVNELNNLSSKG